MRGASVPHVGPAEHPFPTSGLRSIRSPRRAFGASVPHVGPAEHPPLQLAAHSPREAWLKVPQDGTESQRFAPCAINSALPIRRRPSGACQCPDTVLGDFFTPVLSVR
jgi:hypothetical protein